MTKDFKKAVIVLLFEKTESHKLQVFAEMFAYIVIIAALVIIVAHIVVDADDGVLRWEESSHLL